MKVKNNNELWVQNPGTSDVNLSDLGVKVPVGRTVNVYGVNPYLTVAQVKQSLNNGSLSKRLESETLRVVEKEVKLTPHDINRLKESDKPVIAKKTKTSVVVEHKLDDPEDDGSFEFADYGISDLGPDVDTKKQDGGAVVVEAKQDKLEAPVEEPVLEPVLESGVSKQSQIVMKHLQESMTDTTGPFAEDTTNAKQPFTVVKPPEPEKEPAPEVPKINKKARKETTGAVVMDDPGATEKPRSVREVKKAQDDDTDDYTLPGDDAEGADSVTEFKETPFDAKAATKTDEGAVVMKIKETED